MIWVRKKADTWACVDAGEWKSKPTTLFDVHDTRSVGKGVVEFFVPDAVVVQGPATLNPSTVAYRLYLSKKGEWRGPFTTLAAAQGAFNPENSETNHED